MVTGLYGIVLFSQFNCLSGSHFRFARACRSGQGHQTENFPPFATYPKGKGMFVEWQVFIGIGPRKAQSCESFLNPWLSEDYGTNNIFTQSLVQQLDEAILSGYQFCPKGQTGCECKVCCPSGKFFRCRKTLQVPSQLDKWLLCRAGQPLAKGFVATDEFFHHQSQFLSLFGIMFMYFGFGAFHKDTCKMPNLAIPSFSTILFQQNLLMVFCHTLKLIDCQ